jgi:hypothetical protein
MNATYMMRERQMARNLGWLGIGLGVAQLTAPRRLGRLIGVGERPRVLRAVGAREVVSGVGILSQHEPVGWLRARVAGDLMNLLLLGLALRSASGTGRWRVAFAAAVVAGVLALDAVGTRRLAARLY